MSTLRHHIHIICDSTDESLHLWQDALTLSLGERVHITRDLFTLNNDTANYSWRCINKCHLVFLLLGKSYGAINATGVSQLHISYLNAKTKNKPIIAFINNNEPKSKQLNGLIHTAKEQLKVVYEVDDNTDIGMLFGGAYEEFVLGITDFRPNSLVISTLPAEELEPKNPLTPPKASTKIEQVSDLPSSSRFEHRLMSGTTVNAPNLQDSVMLKCTAHAFEGGTLMETAFMAQLSWQDILSSLSHMIVFSVDSLARTLNELITPQAMPIIKLNYPNIHAISRCQVIKADAVWVQEELAKAYWIEKAPSSGKELWRLSQFAKQILTP